MIHWFYLESLRVAHIQYTRESCLLIPCDGGAQGQNDQNGCDDENKTQAEKYQNTKSFFFFFINPRKSGV